MDKALLITVCLCVIGYGLADHGHKPVYPRYGPGYPKQQKMIHAPPPVMYASYQQEPAAHCVGEFFCGLDQTKHGAVAECVNIQMLCNGQKNCRNGADEANCARACRQGDILCGDGRTCGVPCDGRQDCPGGEDENCPSGCFCGAGTFKCPGEDLCLPASKACDGTEDCLNGHDEKDCSAACQCDNGYVCRGTGQCISADQFCNGTPNCGNGDDEAFCPQSCYCERGRYICRHSGNNVKCIEQDELCEEASNDSDDNDCPLGDDERDDICESEN